MFLANDGTFLHPVWCKNVPFHHFQRTRRRLSHPHNQHLKLLVHSMSFYTLLLLLLNCVRMTHRRWNPNKTKLPRPKPTRDSEWICYLSPCFADPTPPCARFQKSKRAPTAVVKRVAMLENSWPKWRGGVACGDWQKIPSCEFLPAMHGRAEGGASGAMAPDIKNNNKKTTWNDFKKKYLTSLV